MLVTLCYRTFPISSKHSFKRFPTLNPKDAFFIYKRGKNLIFAILPAILAAPTTLTSCFTLRTIWK